MRRYDRWLLVAAYVLLISFVAWMSWDLDRRLAEQADLTCITSGVVLESVLLGLEINDPSDTDILFEAIEILEQECPNLSEDYPDLYDALGLPS